MSPARLQSPDYWCEHLRGCVRMADGLGTLWAHSELALLECGPSHTLCNLALRDARRADTRAIVASFDGEDDPEKEWRRILTSAGTLWAAGLPVDLGKLFSLQTKGRRIPLPGYAFQRRRYWLDAMDIEAAMPRRGVAAPEPDGEDPVARAPQNASPAVQRVIDVMHELLGPVHLQPDSDFLLSGGDSLLAVRLAARIGEVFGAETTTAQIMDARTVAKIAALVSKGHASSHGDDKVDRCLVRLAAGNKRLPPIVLVHAVGGGAFIYSELLQALSRPNPVYGLQVPGLWDDTPPIDGLRAQAEHYFDCLWRAGVECPLMIAGSSYGGLVAYELDGLYRKSGHQAQLVVLLDSPGPGQMPMRLGSEAEICAYLMTRDITGRDYSTNLAALQALDQATLFARLLAFLREDLMPHAGPKDVVRLVRVFRQNIDNMWNWVPQPHAARLLFCKASENGVLVGRQPEMAWVPLAAGGIEILPVPGNHSSMLSRPHVHVLAAEINRRLPASAGPSRRTSLAPRQHHETVSSSL